MDDICSPWRHPLAATKSKGPKKVHRTPFTEEQVRTFLKAQGGRCAMESCRVLFSSTGYCTPQQDHDHTTGKARGLLCRRCNTRLGCYERDAKERAAFEVYLSNNT